MKKRIGLTCTLLALFAQATMAQKDPSIQIRSVATVGPDSVILDVLADTKGTPLRSFGFKVGFNSKDLRLRSGGRYAGLWFLRDERGTNHAYTDISQPNDDCVRVVGGRFNGNAPQQGVTGQSILLGTLVFERRRERELEFHLGLASPAPYVSFATAEGKSLDLVVTFVDTTFERASRDTDEDGLPDDFEEEVFGDLRTSDGSTDSDGDGTSDLDEWLAGTDPTDPSSQFTFEVRPQEDGSKLVLWSGQPDRVYDLEWSGRLEKFSALTVGIPGNGELLKILDELHNRNHEGFYRVKIKYPTMGR